jgi:hypothetical protein
VRDACVTFLFFTFGLLISWWPINFLAACKFFGDLTRSLANLAAYPVTRQAAAFAVTSSN